MIFVDPSAPVPEGEHRPAAEEAPAVDSKDAADEKMDSECSRKRPGVRGSGGKDRS